MFLVTIFIVIFIALFLNHQSTKRMRNAVKKIPGPLNLPLIGAMHFFIRLNPQNFPTKSVEVFNQYGKLCMAWAFNRLLVQSADHEINDQFLSSPVHIAKHRSYKIFNHWLGDGLLMSHGKKWFARRKIITPTFHFKILEQFVEVYDQQSTILIEKLSKKADGKTAFDVRPFICVAALDVITDFATRCMEAFDEYGKFSKAWAFNRLIIHSVDYELNDQLLSSSVHIVKHRAYKILNNWLGDGLLMSHGKKWFTRRRIITPTFHFKILEQFVEVYDQQSSILIEKLSKKADGKTAFDVRPLICVAALDVIAETAMGTKVYAQSDNSTPYAIAVNSMTKLLAFRVTKVHLHNDLLYTLLYPHLKLRQMKLKNIMHEFTKKVITERRQALEKQLKEEKCNGFDADGAAAADIGAKKRMALLDVLLQSTVDGKPLSDEDIREEVDTFMFEGHDTTTSAICFALYSIARHPAVQERMLKEIINVLGTDRNRKPTLQDLNELKYTECVIKETLRLYPSVPLIAREIVEDFHYTHSVYGAGIIPAGAEFLVNIFIIGRDSDSYENAEKFIPERHINSDKINAFAFIPFSAGPRNCIGQKFAMLEMKMVLAKILREFELLPLGDAIQLELNLILQSRTGFQLGLRSRT